MMRLPWCLLAVAAACSSSSGGSCPANAVTGTVSSRDGSVVHTFGAIARAYEVFDAGDENAWLLVLDEQPSPDGACGTAAQTGFNLAFVFADQPAAGTYAVIAVGTGGSDATQIIAVADQDGTADLATATGGSLEIDTADPDCLGGNFTATFGSGSAQTLAGTFGADVCIAQAD